MSDVKTVHVKARVNTLGLSPGQEAEIELTSIVKATIEAGKIILLTPEEPEPVKKVVAKKTAAKKAAASEEGDFVEDGANLSDSDS